MKEIKGRSDLCLKNGGVGTCIKLEVRKFEDY